MQRDIPQNTDLVASSEGETHSPSLSANLEDLLDILLFQTQFRLQAGTGINSTENSEAPRR